jgi:hypothetical protein
LAGETKVLGENLPKCRIVHHKPHMLPGREPGAAAVEPSNRSLELQHRHTLLFILFLDYHKTYPKNIPKFINSIF